MVTIITFLTSTTRFLELGSILEPGKPPKMDKAAILSDAARLVTQLRNEAQKLKDSNETFQEKIKDLKAEKNELRDEKQRLKAEKENLEQQIKILNARSTFMPTLIPLRMPNRALLLLNKLGPSVATMNPVGLLLNLKKLFRRPTFSLFVANIELG